MKKLLFLLILLSAGCDNTSTPGNAINLNGVSAIGDLKSGTVTAYDYSQCTKGNELASVTLQDSNELMLRIAATNEEHPVLIELSNYRYQEQWSEQIVNASDKQLFSAIVLSADDEEKRFILSFWTNLAAALAEQKCSTNESLAAEHINQSNGLFSTALTFDINEVKPIPIATFESPPITISTLADARYGIANAAIASYTMDFDGRIGATTPHELYNSATFSEMAYSDLRYEGILNGISAGGPLQFGDVMLNSDVYRTAIPNHMESIIRNLANLPQGIEPNFLTGVAQNFHDTSNSEIFGFTEPPPLGANPGPILRGVSISNCSLVRVGSCCNGAFTDPESVYRTTATIEYDVLDAYSTFEITSISSNPAGLEYALSLSSNIIENASVPWRSGLKPVIQVSQDSTSFEIRNLTVVFTNELGNTLSVTKTPRGNSCTI